MNKKMNLNEEYNYVSDKRELINVFLIRYFTILEI